MTLDIGHEQSGTFPWFPATTKNLNHFSLDYNLSSLLWLEVCVVLLCQIIPCKNIMNLKKMSLKNKDVYGGHDHIRCLTLQECICTYSSEKLACMEE